LYFWTLLTGRHKRRSCLSSVGRMRMIETWTGMARKKWIHGFKCKPEAKTWFRCRGRSCVNSVGLDFTEIWYQGVECINSVGLLWTLLPLDCILLLRLQTCVILVSADFVSYDVWACYTEINVYFLVILLFIIFCRQSFFLMDLVYFAYFYVTVPIIFVR